MNSVRLKKEWVALICLFILFLSGCTDVNKVEKLHQNDISDELIENQTKWEKLSKNLPKITYPDDLPVLEKIKANYEYPKDGHTSEYSDEFSIRERFYEDNPNIFEGILLNLKPMSETVETKATVLIKKVWHGDKSMENKRIYTVFRSGITEVKHAFTSIEGEYLNKEFKPNQKVMMVRKDIPIPKIGEEIIGSFKSFKMTSEAHDETHQHIYGDKYGIDFDKFYMLNNPRTNLWVKNKKSFVLNNPEFKKLKENSEFENLFALTKYWNTSHLIK